MSNKFIKENKMKDGETIVSSKIVHYMYTTHGFPPEMVKEMAEEKGLTVDLDGFYKMMELEKEKSRSNSKLIQSKI